jgi:HEAT repeat protein
VRSAAARALGMLEASEAFPDLLRSVEEDDFIAPFAALALGALRDERAIPALLAAWRRATGQFLSQYFLTAIARIDTDIAAGSLRGLLSEADAPGREAVVLAMNLLTSLTALPALLLAVSDTDRDVRATALYAMTQWPTGRLKQGLRLALEDPEAPVRREAVRIAPFYADAAMAETLQRLCADPEAGVADAASIAFTEYLRK